MAFRKPDTVPVERWLGLESDLVVSFVDDGAETEASRIDNMGVDCTCVSCGE